MRERTTRTREEHLLSQPVEHIDPTAFDGRAIVREYRKAAFQARNLARASDIFNRMLRDEHCTIMLTLAGSLISAGLKKTLITLIENDMVDVIISTGAIMVDQDFLEAQGFRHYQAPGTPEAPHATDVDLGAMRINRIYDTYVKEADLDHCDIVLARILDELYKVADSPWSSRELMSALGAHIEDHSGNESVLLAAHRKEVPIFVPAISDSAIGFAGNIHRERASALGMSTAFFDPLRDFHELSEIKLAAETTGLLMVGGGVPKNFAQDTVIGAQKIAQHRSGEWDRPPKHRYAVQLTVADVRDGALSSSTLREAITWGKVEPGYEQMVFGEATTTLPILASDAYHRGHWQARKGRKLNSMFMETASA